MEPYILDLREERCPMALLKAKRYSKSVGKSEFIIHAVDRSSIKDMIRYFDNHNFFVQVDEKLNHSTLTIIKKEN
ncbi:sulfurtransferase TusA family protein [Vibrio hannami]|uniref:sulfurtransferase TusA family protein n=1 Tax=Vibrio hannami TaxID=2717094 RepID=UPI0024107009|nr:sulfurtransferase TusA family protein [Vibrio hannami]MDG3088833.1 sulfurtransferase TusA family protein [Vibrio hannami]